MVFLTIITYELPTRGRPLTHSHWSSPGATLDGLRLVQDHVLPFDSLEVLDVLDDELIGRDDNVERGVLRVQVVLVPKFT